MKKFLIPSIIMSVAAMAISTHAATMTGKIISNQNNTLQVTDKTKSTPTTLKTTPNTNYYVKKKVGNGNNSSVEDMAEVNEIVEIVYTIDPKTNELIIDELVIFED